MAKTIMIIDDAASIRQVVGFTLSAEGYSVIEAENGKDALRKIENQPVDLFLCDVNMPEMDGIAFLKTIKGDEKYSTHKFAPVIMLTTESGDDKKSEGRDAGARAWMIKPFKPEKLIEAIRIILG